jgi:Killing trait
LAKCKIYVSHDFQQSKAKETIMAFPTAVNSQITDAVTQANVKVLGDAPAMAVGVLYQTVTASLGLAAQNAVTAQQNMHSISMATTSACVAAILGTTPKYP